MTVHPQFAQAVQQGDWRKQLALILESKVNQHATKDKIVSDETISKRSDVLFGAFRDLRKAGFKIHDVRSFKMRHVEALIAIWRERKHSASTCQIKLSVLRQFCDWIDKPGMIGPTLTLMPEMKRDQSAKEDKSWEAAIDIEDAMQRIKDIDRRIYVQARMMRAFGLRQKEAICFQLKLCVSDEGGSIQLYKGTKGGRARVIPIDTPFKRQALDEAIALIRTPKEALGEPGKTLEQNLRRFKYVFERVGLTKAESGVSSHGLRHAYANDRLEMFTGAQSPVRGGKGLDDVPHDQLQFAQLKVAEELGHSRTEVTTCYSGKMPRAK